MRRAWSAAPKLLLLLAAGLVVGLIPGAPGRVVTSELILLVFVPGLVFEAALGVNLHALRHMRGLVILLATVGVALSVGLVAAAVHWGLGMDWLNSVLLGAILAPTDPIAVSATLRRLAAPAQLQAVIEGESLLNDGTGASAFAAVVAILAMSSGGHVATDLAITLAAKLGIGLGIGLLAGIAGALIIHLGRGTAAAMSGVIGTVVVAYGAYGAAEALGGSGVLAVVICGLAIALGLSRSERRAATRVPGFWSAVAPAMNAGLFFLVGFGAPLGRISVLAAATGFVFVSMSLTRLLPVHLLSLLVGAGRRLPLGWRHAVVLGGLRGGLSVAFALVAGRVHGVDDRVLPLAYGAVVLSLLLQGSLVGPLLGRLVARERHSSPTAGSLPRPAEV